MELKWFLQNLTKMKKAVIFTHDLLAENFAKTAHGLLRGTSRFNILAVIDNVHGGKDAGEVLDGKKLDIPTFKSVSDYFENIFYFLSLWQWQLHTYPSSSSLPLQNLNTKSDLRHLRPFRYLIRLMSRQQDKESLML